MDILAERYPETQQHPPPIPFSIAAQAFTRPQIYSAMDHALIAWRRADAEGNTNLAQRFSDRLDALWAELDRRDERRRERERRRDERLRAQAAAEAIREVA